MSKLVVVIQCDIVTKRCSGYACMNTFVNRKDTFADYPPDTRFLMMTCGGCCGAGLSAKLENLGRKLKKYGDAKENVTIHFASCPTAITGRPVLSAIIWPRSSNAKAIPWSTGPIFPA